MTLVLQLVHSKGIPQDSVFFAQGSEAGPLISNKKSIENFKVKCNRNDIVKISALNQEQRQSYGSVEFSAARFLRENRTNPDLYSSREPIKYETNIFNSEEVPSGTLTFHITYIRGLKFMGEKYGNFETLPQKEPVPIYTKIGETRNLFNYFDSGYQDKPCNVMETTYRDDTWGEK